MPILHDWTAKRAGAAITITHATGKITGIVQIRSELVGAKLDRVGLVALRDTGERFQLAAA